MQSKTKGNAQIIGASSGGKSRACNDLIMAARMSGAAKINKTDGSKQ